MRYIWHVNNPLQSRQHRVAYDFYIARTVPANNPYKFNTIVCKIVIYNQALMFYVGALCIVLVHYFPIVVQIVDNSSNCG